MRAGAPLCAANGVEGQPAPPGTFRPGRPFPGGLCNGSLLCLTAGAEVFSSCTHELVHPNPCACVQVPFLQDPNTGASMFESADIMQ